MRMKSGKREVDLVVESIYMCVCVYVCRPGTVDHANLIRIYAKRGYACEYVARLCSRINSEYHLCALRAREMFALCVRAYYIYREAQLI